ncbi:hypothetical protein CMI37_32550 [Candidatus Pacearchaeota archaeon]|nr:hypothetical protein [Candidatus Pacearchaeota archaeon]
MKKIFSILTLFILSMSLVNASGSFEFEEMNVFEKFVSSLKGAVGLEVVVAGSGGATAGEKIRIAYSDPVTDSCSNPHFDIGVHELGVFKQSGGKYLGRSVRKGELISWNWYYTIPNDAKAGVWDLEAYIWCGNKIISENKPSTTTFIVQGKTETCKEKIYDKYCIGSDILAYNRLVCPSNSVVLWKENCGSGEKCQMQGGLSLCRACDLKGWDEWSNNRDNCGVRLRFDICGNQRDKEVKSCIFSSCGDDICQVTETELSCKQDCGIGGICGDTICESGEDCPYDCGGWVIRNNECVESNQAKYQHLVDCEKDLVSNGNGNGNGNGSDLIPIIPLGIALIGLAIGIFYNPLGFILVMVGVGWYIMKTYGGF